MFFRNRPQDSGYLNHFGNPLHCCRFVSSVELEMIQRDKSVAQINQHSFVPYKVGILLFEQAVIKYSQYSPTSLYVSSGSTPSSSSCPQTFYPSTLHITSKMFSTTRPKRPDTYLLFLELLKSRFASCLDY